MSLRHRDDRPLWTFVLVTFRIALALAVVLLS